jgi:hypothetical protein
MNISILAGCGVKKLIHQSEFGTLDMLIILFEGRIMPTDEVVVYPIIDL